MDEARARAYRAGATIARQRIEKEAPLDAEALRAVRASDIVVVRGCYDHVELVLDALELPFVHVAPEQLGSVPLRPSSSSS